MPIAEDLNTNWIGLREQRFRCPPAWVIARQYSTAHVRSEQQTFLHMPRRMLSNVHLLCIVASYRLKQRDSLLVWIDHYKIRYVLIVSIEPQLFSTKQSNPSSNPSLSSQQKLRLQCRGQATTSMPDGKCRESTHTCYSDGSQCV